MKESKFLPYTKQSITSEDAAEVVQTLTSSIITRGPKVDEFENAIAEYCGAKYGVVFSSGTAALMAACFAAKLTPHDRILTTPNTFVATVSAPMHRNAVPVFVDIDRTTGNMDLDQVENNLSSFSSRGRLIVMPVHFSGIPVNMQKLARMVCDPETMIIEDASHALGAQYPSGEKVGSCTWSHMTVFSFHPAKNITTGEGGMVTTNDEELCHRLRLFRNNGIERDLHDVEGAPDPWYYEVHEISGNYHLSDFQAALGMSQLKRLDAFVKKRKKLVEIYRKNLQELPSFTLFSPTCDSFAAYHLFVVQIELSAHKITRKEVMEKLKEAEIGTQVHYIPVYRHPFFKNLCGDISAYFPQMETYYAQALSLPLYYDMEKQDVERVCRTLRVVLGTNV